MYIKPRLEFALSAIRENLSAYVFGLVTFAIAIIVSIISGSVTLAVCSTVAYAVYSVCLDLSILEEKGYIFPHRKPRRTVVDVDDSQWMEECGCSQPESDGELDGSIGEEDDYESPSDHDFGGELEEDSLEDKYGAELYDDGVLNDDYEESPDDICDADLYDGDDTNEGYMGIDEDYDDDDEEEGWDMTYRNLDEGITEWHVDKEEDELIRKLDEALREVFPVEEE